MLVGSASRATELVPILLSIDRSVISDTEEEEEDMLRIGQQRRTRIHEVKVAKFTPSESAFGRWRTDSVDML